MSLVLQIDPSSFFTDEQLDAITSVPFTKLSAVADMQEGVFTPNVNKDAYGMFYHVGRNLFKHAAEQALIENGLKNLAHLFDRTGKLSI